MSKLAIKGCQQTAQEDILGENDCLTYAKKINMAMVMPRALLLLQQARNKSTEAIPRSVFAYRAHQQLELYQKQAHDELYLELGIEYEDYVRGIQHHKIEDREEYKKILEEQRDAIRQEIMS